MKNREQKTESKNQTKPPDDWWPLPLQHLKSYSAQTGNYTVVAEITRPQAGKSYRHTYTAFVHKTDIDTILSHIGCIGHEVNTSGPRPSGPPFEPRFWVDTLGVTEDNLEPFVISWNEGEGRILLPDAGFLMTYGLVPNVTRKPSQWDMHWNDMSFPNYDVVLCKINSRDYFGEVKEARINVLTDYLQDYVTLRNMCLIQVYYEQNVGYGAEADYKLLNDQGYAEFELPRRKLVLKRDEMNHELIFCMTWGFRLIAEPGILPVTDGYRDYGELIWPGIEKPVTENYFGPRPMPFVYVKDSVLGEYEKHANDYDISPESGGVAFRGKWSVSYSHRVGRDLIMVEVAKLYEGTPPYVVKHWHNYATEKPTESPEDLRSTNNIAKRAKWIVDSLLSLGETLAEVAHTLIGINVNGTDFIGLDRSEVNYNGWWNNPIVKPISFHIPESIGESEFLSRCSDLSKLIIEGLDEKELRKLLVGLQVKSSDIRNLGNLKLFEFIVYFARIVNETGLDPQRDQIEIWKRVAKCRKAEPKPEELSNEVSLLFILSELRNVSDHRNEDIKKLYKIADIDENSVKGKMGLALDALYDSLAETIETVDEVISRAFLE